MNINFIYNHYKGFILYIVLLSSLTLSNCTSESETLLEPYFDTLPEYESINASIYNYELLTEQAKNSFENHQYLEVLDIYQKYLEIFYESEIPNENHLLYYTGMSLKRLCETHQLSSDFEKFLNQHSKSFQIFGIHKNEDQSIDYNHIHLRKILENRLNYLQEWNVLREYYLEDFILEPKTSKEYSSNFEYLYYLSTHFPNMIDYSYLLSNQNLINLRFLNRKQREKVKNIEKIFESYKNNHSSIQASVLPVTVFSKTGGLVLRSRTSLISSRNFARLEAWEPLTLIKSVKGEDDKLWWEVVYKEISIPKAYIPAAEGFLIEVETLSGQALNLHSLEKAEDLEAEKQLKQYLSAVQAFYNQDYLSAVETLSQLIPQAQEKTLERSLTLLYKTLYEIAQRSTSLKNDYTEFVRKHALYFRVFQATPEAIPELKITDNILKMLIETNPNSVMLQYYTSL